MFILFLCRVEYWAKRIGKNIKEFSDDVTATENIKKVNSQYMQ